MGIIKKIKPNPFVVQYLLFGKTYTSMWQINQSYVRFDKDLYKMKYLWPRYFDKVSGEYQSLNKENKQLLMNAPNTNDLKIGRAFC